MLGNDVTQELFYKTFSKTWSLIETDIVRLQKESHKKTMEDVMAYIEKAYHENFDCILPVAALLTGINQPDHLQQFENIKFEILARLDAKVSIVQSRDCLTLKSAIETMVRNFIDSSNDEEEQTSSPKKIRKSQCTMQNLENWYINQCSEQNERLLVIILPDFECFNTEVLQDLILILHAYCHKIAIVLVLGVATATSAIHNTLSYRVTSKIRLKLFQTTSAVCSLNKIFDEIILSPKYSFNLSGKVAKFLSDIFLFYDFSINGFVQEFKYCLLEHFLQGNAFSLCTDFEDSIENLKYLTHEDFELLRQLPSFRPYVESITNPIKVLSVFITSKYWLKKLVEQMKKCQIYFKVLRCFIVFVSSLVEDLPKSSLGKTRRELYSICMSKTIVETEEFCECWKMLAFISKSEFVSKMNKAITEANSFIGNHLNNSEIDLECKALVSAKFSKLESLLKIVIEAGTDAAATDKSAENKKKLQLEMGQINRQQLKEKLLQMSKEEIPISDFLHSVHNILEFIKTDIVVAHLGPPAKFAPTFNELFIFSDIQLARKHLIGTPRAALHTALNDPQIYLQCNCCQLDSAALESLKPTMPDISVAYKLHLECGKLINLYDWLQAFRSIVDYQEEESEQVDPKIQARFTRAVAELQFLGYIKTSKRKTDHVTRLTW